MTEAFHSHLRVCQCRNMGEAETVPSDEKQAETGICTAEESIVWSQEVEVCLFHAMLGHKPVGKMN